MSKLEHPGNIARDGAAKATKTTFDPAHGTTQKQIDGGGHLAAHTDGTVVPGSNPLNPEPLPKNLQARLVTHPGLQTAPDAGNDHDEIAKQVLEAGTLRVRPAK